MSINLAIIGGGPAGLSAGLYATRGGTKDVVMFEKGMVGGQITSSSEMENYPGVAQVTDGMTFMMPWSEQSTRFGLEIRNDGVKRVRKVNGEFEVVLDDDSVINAKSVIVCTGSTPKKAGFKGEKEYFGMGVSTCATCDGFFYKDKEVAVLGGGDTALEEAIYLSNICSKVYLIHRRDGFRAAATTVQKAKNNPKIEFVLNAVVDEVKGDNAGVNEVCVKFNDGSTRSLMVPGIFTFVGLDVLNDVLKDENGNFICEVSERGEVVVDLSMKTSVDGLFAAGDIRIQAPKQVVCAAADGATAALSAMSYLEHLKK